MNNWLISPGDLVNSLTRGLRLTVLSILLLGLFARPIPVLAATYSVNSTDDMNDGTCDAAHCSLREAINAANASAGLDEILFDLLPVGSVIILTDLLPIITDGQTKLRGDLHPGYAGTPVIGIDGVGAVSAISNGTAASFDFAGLITIESSSSDIRGLAVFNFGIGPAILVRGAGVAGCTIRDNFLGTDLTGTTAIPNAYGIYVEQSTGTVIQDNLISGNYYSGIILAGGGVSGTTIQGNKIGTDFSGTLALGNQNGIVLIPLDTASLGPSGNTIGGATSSDGNVISAANETGVILDKASLNIIQNNLIGTDEAGLTDLGNALTGIYIMENSDDNSVLNNTISGNDYVGIYLKGADNMIQGNKIGTDAAGGTALGNFGGILVESTYGGNLIGGPAAGQGNLISGNTGTGGSLGLSGVRVFGASTNPNIIQGNFIGTDLGGAAAIPNAAAGIELMNDVNNQVLDNLISANGLHGVQLYNSTGALIRGNKIGTDSSGAAALGNGFSGIHIHPAGAQNVTIGGAGSGQGNLISGNGAEGIDLTGSDHLVQGNNIGTDIAGTSAIPNGGAGILLQPSTIAVWPLDNILIGGSDPSTGNIISGNSGYGIEFGAGEGYATGTIIQNNHIGSDASGSSVIPNAEGGIRIFGSDTLVGGANAGNVITHNNGAGIEIYGPNLIFAFSVGNTMSRNRIFQNDSLGLDLGENGVTTNDPGDGDDGANGFLNYPEFTSVTASTVEGTACDGCLVELFAADEDPSGFGEGMTFISDGIAAGGVFSIDVSNAGLGACDKVTATATDMDGNTSEFSPNSGAGSCISVPPLILVLIVIVLTFGGAGAGGIAGYGRRRPLFWHVMAGTLAGGVIGGGLLVAVALLPNVRVHVSGPPVPAVASLPLCDAYLDVVNLAPAPGTVFEAGANPVLKWTARSGLPEGQIRWSIEIAGPEGVLGEQRATGNTIDFSAFGLDPSLPGFYLWRLTGEQAQTGSDLWQPFCGKSSGSHFQIAGLQVTPPALEPTPTATPTTIPVPVTIPPTVDLVPITIPPQPPTVDLVPITIPSVPPTETFTPPPPQDTDGPGIKGVSASPDPIYATTPKGCKPSASVVSAAISDPSGVGSVELIYKGISAGSVSMSNAGGNQWQAQLGPFDAPGAVNYRIRAFDSPGNQSITEFFPLTVLACIP